MRLKQITFYISIIVVLFISCDSNVEINAPFIEPVIPANFQVDFDGETWVAETKEASIIDGEITITATKNEGTEIVIINLLDDQVNTYNIAPGQDVANISYNNTEAEFGLFMSKPELLGSIDLEENDTENQLLSGRFFFNGTTVLIQQFEEDGITPILEEVVDPDTGEITFEEVFIAETKEFTNGIFEKIVYTTNNVDDPDPEPPLQGNHFTVDIEFNDGTIDPFVASQITAIKSNGFITVTGTRGQEVFTLTMPDDIVNNNHLLLPFPTPSPDEDAAISYLKATTSQIFIPLTTNDTQDKFLGVDYHNVNTNRIEGTFQFLGTSVSASGTETLQFDGAYAVTYTE